MEEKPRKKWSTLREESGDIKVAGRQIVERTIVSLSDYRVSPLRRTDDEATFRVEVQVSIGDADERAIVKAFTALGEHVSKKMLDDDMAA